jgi:hypothetical protein
MHWPPDHPAVTDAALVEWANGADEVAPGATVLHVVRHLVGRRVATTVHLANGRRAVLKVFAGPRARGNDRRLHLLRSSRAGDLTPAPLGVDASGHVSLVEWVEGDVFDQLDDDAFVRSAHAVGEALRALHHSGSVIDRTWTIDNEISLLDRRSTSLVATLLDSIGNRDDIERALGNEPLVSAHRDCHPRQVVHGARWIDLDDCAMAPAGLDVGNMLAHLRRDAVIGLRSPAAASAAVDRFRDGYGAVPSTTAIWEQLSLIRLCGLAETRHQRPDWAAAIADLVLPVSHR